ncbi:Leucine-rich repeat-containing protein 74A [Tritrichomonas musculus]|uniref:Leucine-rich repeat-containing protein 74A n=1 Tax=Tritrichomonas musculus TaxID=1915356 RepID=A0ABR2L0R4_9EUKA
MSTKAAAKKTVAGLTVSPVLKGCVTDEEMYYLFEAKCRDFDIQPTTKLFERFLNHQAKKPFKKVFDMSFSAIGPGSSLFAATIILNKTCLRVINMGGNNIGDRGARYFAQLIQESENLVSLNLSSNLITDKGAEAIFLAMCDNKFVISLNLGSESGVNRNSFGSKACQALKKMLTENKVLSELDIPMTEITCDTIEIIAKGIRCNSTLEHFNVSNNNIQSKGVSSLLKSCAKSQIRSIHVANNQIKDDISTIFSSYLEKNRSIEIIDLSGNYLTEKFFNNVSKQLKASSVTSLNLNNNPLRGKGASSLGVALNGECRMKHLSFANCQVDASGFCEFCDHISRNTSLVSLHIGHNPILDEGAIRLSHVIKRHPSLKDIDLEMCEITEEGGSLLFSAFSVSTSISRINVKNNLIKNGVIIQKCLTENPRIFYLNADYNTMDYKITVEIQRLVSENIKRWKSGQKNRVKEKVGQLHEVNLQLDDTRQSIIEEREYIGILRKQFDEMTEEEERIKLSMEATNDELQKKLDEYDKIVGGILLESQSKKDDLRAVINEKESEISSMQNRLDNTSQKVKQSQVSLLSVEKKIEEEEARINTVDDELRIKLANAKAKYKDMKALLIEAWNRQKEEQREAQMQLEQQQQEEHENESLQDEQTEKVEKSKKKSKSRNSKSKESSPSKDNNSTKKGSKSKNINNAIQSTDNLNESEVNDSNNGEVKHIKNKSPKKNSSEPNNTSNEGEVNDSNNGEVKHIKRKSPKKNSNEPNNLSNESEADIKSSNEELFESNATLSSINFKLNREGDVNSSSTNSMATFSSTATKRTNDSLTPKSSKSSLSTLSKRKLDDLTVEGENKGEIENDGETSSNTSQRQLHKSRSKSVQAATPKRPKIVIPVLSGMKNKRSQNQVTKPQVTFLNQVIP